MEQINKILDCYNPNIAEIKQIKLLFSNLLAKSLIDIHLPDYHEYTNTLYDFIKDYPNIRIKDFEDEEFKYTIMQENEEMFKKAMTSELIFTKDKLFNPKNICYIAKFTQGDDVFYEVEHLETYEHKHKIKYLCSFFRVKDGKICNVYSQLPSKDFKNILNIDEFKYLVEYEFSNDRDLIFDFPDKEIIFNILPEMLELATFPFVDCERIFKSLVKDKPYNIDANIEYRNAKLQLIADKIPKEIYEILF